MVYRDGVVRFAAGLVLALAVAAVACSSPSNANHAADHSTASSPSAAGASGSSASPVVQQERRDSGPKFIRARPLGRCSRAVWTPGPPGSPIPRAVLGSKAVASPDVHFALADRRSFFSVVYPAISTDGGRTWSVDGPCFYYAAAQGANAVTTIEARAPNWAYAWGYGGSFVKSTHDGGAHWFAADFPSSIVRVTTKGDSVFVKLYRSPSSYVSHDYGLTWRLV